MSVILSEIRLSLTKLAQREDVNVSTVWRWVRKGVRGIRLESYCVGVRRYTSEEAFARFVASTTAAAHGDSPDHCDKQQPLHGDTIEAELRELGI